MPTGLNFTTRVLVEWCRVGSLGGRIKLGLGPQNLGLGSILELRSLALSLQHDIRYPTQ